MIKVKLFLEAKKDIPRTNWKKGDTLELVNDIFCRNTGVAFWSLDLGWEVKEIVVLENGPNKISRCCGRCDGVTDICHADRICKNHNETGCEICFGAR